MDLNTAAAVFTIIGGASGVIGAIIGGMALSKSTKANKTANEALNKTQNTIHGNNNTTINNQKVGKKSSVINGNNSSM